jgi:phospholipase/carboxylesterase
MPTTGRIHARPQKVTRAAPTGLQPLAACGERDSYLYVPGDYSPQRPCALAVVLHGSGGHAHHGLELLSHLADEAGIILVAPASHSYTWDFIVSRWGKDVASVNDSLEFVFRNYAVDAGRLAMCGFSDGASYALSLGLTNGDLFSHIIAFSPGFVAPAVNRDHPRIFISHGVRDEILPVSMCSRRIVPRLRGAGLAVEYVEFDAGHRIPGGVAARAVEWFVGEGRGEGEGGGRRERGDGRDQASRSSIQA